MDDDRALVEQQLGRPPRAFRRVARRCPYGTPAVTEQEPYDDAGDPFPTTYYLTCPYLVAAVARLDAAGAQSGRDGGASLDLGIGGSANPRRLKCLHAHVAYALARPGYGLGDAILAEVEPLWPAQGCCMPRS